MKKALVLITAIILSFTGHSQNLFKEIYESLDKNDRFSNMMNLRLYQEIYPDRAITYFLLGNIFEQYMQESDPLLKFDVLEIYHNQFNIFFGLLKLKLDNKQANQDRDYFGEIAIITDKRKAGLPDILNEIERRIAEENAYFIHAKAVHDNYIRCITKYNDCLFEYRRINRAFADYKTLYLTATSQIRSEVLKLSGDFDSVLIYFNAYKNACKKLPQLLRVNDYELNGITTYRLEGLTESDFTASTVQLWDFKSWAHQFLLRMDTDISAIRKGIDETDRQLSLLAEKLKIEDIYYDKSPYTPGNDKLHYLTGKYDYASITNELLAYKKSKTAYLMMTRSKTNDPEETSDFELANKLMFFKELADTKVMLNKHSEQLKKRISVENTSKYLQFFFERYKGMEGFSRWCEMEKYDNDLIFNRNLANLKNFFSIADHTIDFSDSILTFNKKKIAFGVQREPEENPVTDTLITLKVTPFRKRWYFVNGYEFKKDGSKSPFYVKINPEGKVDWMVNPEPKGIPNTCAEVSFLHLPDDSISWLLCKAAQVRKDSVLQYTTCLSRINWNGKIVKQHTVGQDCYPVYFWVDEINQQYLVVLCSSVEDAGHPGLKDYQIRLYNFDDSPVWQKSFSLDGEFLEIIHSNTNFYLLCHYTTFSFVHPTGTATMKGKHTGIAGLFIERNGNVTHINDYTFEKEISGIFCRKVYDNTITLFGEGGISDTDQSRYFYLLVDNQGIPGFSNVGNLKFKSTTMQ